MTAFGKQLTPHHQEGFVSSGNSLLGALPSGTLRPEQLLRMRFQKGDLARGLGDRRYLVFPDDGLMSLEFSGGEGSLATVALVGREGCSGIELLLGLSNAWSISIVQVGPLVARTLDMPSAARLFEQNAAFRNILLGYYQDLLRQVAAISAARAVGDLPTRLARLILMLHQRVDGDTIEIMHHEIAKLLGTGRPGVTEALHILEGLGAIRATRGTIHIRDSKTLCEAGQLMLEGVLEV